MTRKRALWPLLALPLLLPLLHCDGDGEPLFELPAPAVECDADGDGVLSDAPECGGTDCDDLDPDNYPGNAESCVGSADNDCDGFVDGADADCSLVVMQIQQGEALMIASNVQEACDDVAQIEFEHRSIGAGGPMGDAILRRITVSFTKQDPNEPADCPYDSLSYDLGMLVPSDGTLQIDNFPVVPAMLKTMDPLSGPLFAEECIATLRAELETVAGDAHDPATLDMSVTFGDFPPRVPPCPSQR